jgi:O-antigen ligase
MLSYSVIAEKSLFTCRWLAIISGIAAPISTAVTSVTSAVLLITWLASGEVLTSLKIAAKQAVGKMLLLFLAWVCIGTWYSDTSWHDKVVTLLSWKKLLYTFVLFGLFYQERWKRLFIQSYLIIMIIFALLSLALWLAAIPTKTGEPAGIIMTNHVSQSMAFVAAMVCGIFLLAEQNSQRKKYLLALAILLFLFNIFFISIARSGYLAVPVAAVFAVVCLYGYKKLPHIIGIVTLVLIVTTFTSTTLQQRIKQGLDEKVNYQTSENVTSVGIRVIFAQNTIALIKQNPVLGYGTSSFKSTYSPYAAKKYPDWRGGATTDPHNQYLFIWLENGLVGLVLFLSYLAVALYQGVKYQPYGAIAASFLSATCATSLFNSHFKTFPEGFLVAFFVGILLTQHNRVTMESPARHLENL